MAISQPDEGHCREVCSGRFPSDHESFGSEFRLGEFDQPEGGGLTVSRLLPRRGFVIEV